MSDFANHDKLIGGMKIKLGTIKRNQSKNLRESKLYFFPQNELLEDFVQDYKSDYDKIKEQKNQQYDTLVKMSEYINNVTRDLKKTDTILKETTNDQKQILAEMNNIKKEIDELDFFD